MFPIRFTFCLFIFRLYKSLSNTPFISPNSQSLRTELHFQFIALCCCYTPTPVRFGLLSHRASDLCILWKCGLKTEQDRAEGTSSPRNVALFGPFPPHYLVHPFTLTTAPSQTAAFGYEYASKTTSRGSSRPQPHRMRLFWLRCQIMRLRSVNHIKPHYSQNAFDSALLAWYERGISHQTCFTSHLTVLFAHM